MTYDLFIFYGAGLSGDRRIVTTLGNPGYQCTGIQKIAQTFTKIFMTDKGSVNGDPAMGTDFMRALRTGGIRDEVSLQGSFQSAVIDVLNYVSQFEDNATPDDERLVQATLVNWDLQRDRLSIKVALTSAAGTTRVYAIPINTGISQ